MGHFFDEKKDLFIGRVLTERDKMDFVVLACGLVGMQAQSCIVVVEELLGVARFGCTEEKSGARFLGKSVKLLSEFWVDVVGTPKTQRHGKFRPYDQTGSLFAGLGGKD